MLGAIADHPVGRVAERLPWAVPGLAARLDQRSSHGASNSSARGFGRRLTLDMLEPACITFEASGGGEFVFGAVRDDLDCRYGPDGVRLTR